jgi:MSHA pilin protein MshD
MFISRKVQAQAGLSLIELIIFIVVVSVAVAGVLKVLELTVRNSADPLIRKQALAIAESLLEEVQLQPFTFCDPNDSAATTATSTAACTILEPGAGTLQGENRYTAGAPYNNVIDYDGFNTSTYAPAGMRDILGALIPALAGYQAVISVVPTALGSIPAAESLLITVTVTGPANTSVRLQGFRTRYAPNSVP